MELKTLQKILEFDCVKNAALCTQIDWSGSVPRKDFPMMLVAENHITIGTIGGGVLENNVINLAQSVIKYGKPELKYYELTSKDVEGTDSICGGKTTILIEPFLSDIQNIYRKIIDSKIIYSNILVLKVATQPRLRILRQRITKDYHLAFPRMVVKEIDSAIRQKFTKSVNYSDDIWLIQYIGERPKLHIFGAGHVAKAIAELAEFIEFDTFIYDDRKDLATPDRFPFAKEIITNEITYLIQNVTISRDDFVIVATRGHQHDYKLMQWLLPIELSYLGLMSSKKKWQLLSEALINDGFSQQLINTVHSPIGLDIGSATVSEIAVSIIAEIINHYQNKSFSKISLSKI